MISVSFVVLINLKVFVVVEIVAWVTLNMNVSLRCWLELLNPPQWGSRCVILAAPLRKVELFFQRMCSSVQGFVVSMMFDIHGSCYGKAGKESKNDE